MSGHDNLSPGQFPHPEDGEETGNFLGRLFGAEPQKPDPLTARFGQEMRNPTEKSLRGIWTGSPFDRNMQHHSRTAFSNWTGSGDQPAPSRRVTDPHTQAAQAYKGSVPETPVFRAGKSTSTTGGAVAPEHVVETLPTHVQDFVPMYRPGDLRKMAN